MIENNYYVNIIIKAIENKIRTLNQNVSEFIYFIIIANLFMEYEMLFY